MDRTTIRFKKIDPKAVKPERKTTGSAGYDLVPIEGGNILPGEMKSFKTGIVIELPEGTVGEVFPRSSRFAQGLYICGIFDSDYRGEYFLQIRNVSSRAIHVCAGERYAQLIITQLHPYAEMVEVDSLTETERGASGFGSTGI